MGYAAVRRVRVRKKAARTGVFLLLLLAGLWVWTAAARFVPAAVQSGLPHDRAGATEAQRQAFIAALGRNVLPEPIEERLVRIPREFDDVYTAYNAVQLRQGLDLRRHRGRLCMRYTYALQAGDEAGEQRLHLLVRRGKIIGGDVCALFLGAAPRPLLPAAREGGADPL